MWVFGPLRQLAAAAIPHDSTYSKNGRKIALRKKKKDGVYYRIEKDGVCVIHRIAKDGGVIHRPTRIAKNEGKNCLSE
jgi:hypothetical protein